MVALLTEKLGITGVYSSALHRSATVDKLFDEFVRAVRKLITLSVSTEAEKFSPSDFLLAGLDEKGLLELEYALAETGESTNNTDDNDHHERAVAYRGGLAAMPVPVPTISRKPN
jgi:hypothetical protein